jgi:hypothetical protein
MTIPLTGREEVWMTKLARGLVVAFFLSSGVVASAGSVSVTLSLTGLDEYVGDRLEARVVDIATGGEPVRLAVSEIPAATVDLVLEPLETDRAYRVDVYVVRNRSGRYDRPPEDAAWRIDLGTPSGAAVSFAAAQPMVDIDWPPAADGVIGPDEYRHVLLDSETGITLYWQNDATTLYVGLLSPGTGWAAVGFGAQNKMAGANIVIGTVTDGVLTLEDHFGSGPVSHSADRASSLLQRAGSESLGKTILEFALPLVGADPEDVTLLSGQNVVAILAFHATADNLTTKHTGRSTVRITLD